jgi:polar amino acid transport system permease protein
VQYSLLLGGIWYTLLAFSLSFVIGSFLAVVLGSARLSARTWTRRAAMLWVEFFRGISTPVLLFWLYYVLPMFGVEISALAASVIALSLVHGAYGSEIVRGALKAVDRGQKEAAQALGLSSWTITRKIVWPQALAIVIPPMGNAMVMLLKGTSLASIIALPELTYQSNLIVNRTYDIFGTFSIVLASYYVLSQACLASTKTLERRIGHWRTPEGAR